MKRPNGWRKYSSPRASEKRQWALNTGARFVHYTSAENAINIIRTGEVWLRNARTMNDYMEIDHGIQRLYAFFGDEERKRSFLNHFDSFVSGLAEETIRQFDNWTPGFRRNTYLLSISEHDDSEDSFGRLSMWRAYARSGVGVAVVLNAAPFLSDTDALGAYSSPVSYLSEQGFNDEVFRILGGIAASEEFLRTIPNERISGYLFTMLMFASVASKHEGFAEEREWRVIHIPGMYQSDVITQRVEIINRVPANSM